jgi:hypothetical protein
MLGVLGIDGVLGMEGIDGGFIPPPMPDMLDAGLIGGIIPACGCWAAGSASMGGCNRTSSGTAAPPLSVAPAGDLRFASSAAPCDCFTCSGLKC